MSEDTAVETPAPQLPSSARLIGTLAGIAMLSGLLVVLAYQLTAPRIEANKRQALEDAVFEVLPGAESRANFQLTDNDLTALSDDQLSEANLYAGYDGDGQLIGYAMEASARGYQDVVRILYGYDPATECVTGFTVLQSTETPGLGDKIERDEDFLANFDCLKAELNEAGTAMEHDIVTVKNGTKIQPWQIDGISGATVTSTAIGTALRRSTSDMLPLLAQHNAEGMP